MKTLESRLNEVERVLNADNADSLPCFIYMSSDKDDEQAVEQAKLKAYKEYKARNIERYPQLGAMELADFEKVKNTTVHIKFTDCSKGASV